MNRIIPAVILTLFVTLCFWQLAYAKETAKASQPASGAATEQAIATEPALADLVLKAAELSERLTALEERLEEVFDPSAAESSFRRAEERLSDLSSRLKELKTAKTTGYNQLIQLKTALQQERDFLETNLEPVTASLRKVSALRKEWSKDPFDDETVARVGKFEFIAIEDVVEESSKVSAPAVPGALFFGASQKGKKGKGLF